MSTEHQKYSTENQAEAIRRYAAARAIDIVTTYADEGKSGLSIDGRDALKHLLEDVEGGRANFQTILVYDVSRWGRFQDSDEAAFYEYICRRAGITVDYCAEQFENDGIPIATIVKERQARHGRRVQPRALHQGVHWPVQAGRTRLSSRGRAGLRVPPMLVDNKGEPKASSPAANRRACRPTASSWCRDR